jgi:hypothetical protein
VRRWCRGCCDPVVRMAGPGNHLTTSSGLSPQDLRRNFRELLKDWADYENEKPAGWLTEQWESRIDPKILDDALAALEDAHGDEQRARARRALEPIIARGLVRREGQFVAPPAIVKSEMLKDWVIWRTLRLAYEHMGGDISEVQCELWGERFQLVVCESCSAVFRPVRRARQASRCHLCRHRPAAAALGSPETLKALAAGQPVTIRVPERVGNVVTSWKLKTLIRCPECREPAFVRSGATTCGKPACRSRRRRRQS